VPRTDVDDLIIGKVLEQAAAADAQRDGRAVAEAAQVDGARLGIIGFADWRCNRSPKVISPFVCSSPIQ